MKLHLPKSLRTALLSCLAAISPWSLTLASGAISVGAVVFSLGAQAQAETISITADTKWNATTNHSADVTTVSGSGTDLMVRNANGDGHAGMSAGATLELGDLTMESGTNLNLWAWTSTVKTVSTTDKVIVNGSITLDNAELSIQDGSYYFNETLNVVGKSKVYTQYAKGLVFDSLSGDENAVLTFQKGPYDQTAALFTIGGSNAEASSDFKGTIKLLGNSSARTADLAINDAEALRNAAVSMDGNSKMVIMLQQVMAEAVYGNGMIVKSTDAVTGHATPVLQITGNATESQAFSGTMASNLTWQIGDGAKDASSRFNGATLNGTLDIKAGSTAYLTGDNTFGTLTNNGTLHLSEGSSFVITSQAAYQGATITGLGVISGITGNTFSYGNGWLATYDAATKTATLDDVAVYWSDAGTDGNIEWSDSSNWSSVTVPASNQAVRLTADNAGKEISVSGNVTVKELRVYGSYTLNVSGSFASVDGYNFFEGGSITKTGAGTLSMSVADATVAPIIVSEGTLKITDTLKQVGYKANDSVDLSGLNVGANGVLSIAASGDQKAPGSGNGTNVSHITLGSDFKGVVEVRSGKLHVATTNATTTGSTYGSPSNLGGATGIRFDGGGLLISSQGEKFDNRQVFSLNLEVGSSGGYIDLFGGSGSVQDGWSATHTGTMSGSGTLTFIGMGEWVLAGSDYSKFTGSIELGDQTQRLYISSDMENVKSFSWNAAYSDAPSVVVGYGSASAVKVTVADKQEVTKGGSSILLTNDAAFTHTGGVAIADGKTLNIGSFEDGSGVYNAGNVEFASASSKLAVAGNVVANITGTSAYTATCGTIEIASGSTVNDYRALTVDGDVRISGAGTYEQLGSLTINAGKTLTLSGDVTLSALTNNGTITFDALNSLTLKGFSDKDSYDGSECYAIGNVTGGDTLAWNELLGMGDRTVSYDATSGILSLGGVPVLQWVDTAADDESAWGETSNWQLSGGSSHMVPLASSKVLLSADAQYSDTVTLTGDVTVDTLTVARNHNLSVAEGVSATLSATTIALENGATLAKTGEGTLVISKDVTAFSEIAAGTLKLEGSLGDSTGVDLTRFSGAGTLAVTAAGTSGEANNAQKTVVTLSESFTGTLSVVGGHLDATNTNLGGAAGVLLDGGTLFSSGDGTVKTVSWNVSISDNGGYFRRNGHSGSDETTSYATNFTGKLTGGEQASLTIIDAGEWTFTSDSDLSDWKGSVIVAGNQNNVAFQSAADFKSLTVHAGHKISVGNVLTVDSLAHSGAVFDVKGTNAHLTATTSDLNAKITVADSGKADLGAVTTAAGIQLDFLRGATATMDSLSMEGNLTLHLDGGAWAPVQSLTIGKQGVEGAALALANTLTVHLYYTSSLTDYNGISLSTDASKLDISGAGTTSLLGGLTQSAGEVKLSADGKLVIEGYNQTGGSLNTGSNSLTTLKGATTLSSITNSGSLNLSAATSLTLNGFNDAATTVDGTQTFALGTVQNGATMNWNALLGIDTAAADTAYYARYTNGVVSYIDLANTSLVWADTDDAESAWGEVSNWIWSDNGNNAVVPTAATNVLLTAGAAEKTLTLSGDAVAKSLTVQGAYNLHVETGQTATLTPASLVMDGDAASLTKTGEGVLSMTSTNAIAGKIAVNEGTLALTDRLRGDAEDKDGAGEITYEADFSSLNVGVNGTLAINAADKASNNRTTVKLSDSFAGTLEIVSGYVDTDSAFSGATIKVNGGGLLSRVPAGDITNNVVIGENGATFYSLGSTGVDGTWKTKFTGAFSGSGTLTIQERGDWYFAGDMSGFTGSIELNNKYDRVFFYSSASVSSFSATDRLDGNATVYFGDGTKAMEFVVNDAMTVGSDTSFEVRKNAMFGNTGLLTVNANFNVTGAGAYEMNGGLVINAGKTLTLNVAEASIASITNNGTLTLGANLTSLTLGDFEVGTDYVIGTVTDGATKDWRSLLGLGSNYSIVYADGILTSSFLGDIVWISPKDDDITWGGADNWKVGENGYITVGAKDNVVLGNAASLGELNDSVTRKIVLDANASIGSVTVQDAYSFSVAEGANYSFDANTIVLAEGGSLSKVGAGTLSMSSEDAVAAKMNIAEGTLSLSDTLGNYDESGARVDLTALSGAGTLSISAAGASGVTGTGTGQRTVVTLSDSFTGTLAVVAGNLDMASTIGRAGSVLLDGATLVGTGELVQNLGWNIAVGDNGAYLRRFGNAGYDERTSYATRLTGTLTGGAAAMLTVVDNGEWFFAGDMSGYQGGLSITGDTNYVTFESSATLASLSAVGDSHILVDNGATLDTATTAVSGTVTTGATEGATLNLGAVTVNESGILKIDGAGTHTLSTLAMGNNSTLELAAGTNAGITESAPHAIGNGDAVSIKLGEGATLTDAGSWQLTGSTMTVQGGGEYKLDSLVLSANQAGNTTVNVESGTTLHITGTATNNSKLDAAFGLGHWNADNAVNVRGVLELECGISSYSGYSNTATITVENGGKMAFNNGLHAAGKDNAGVININGGGVLEVSGTNVTGTNLVTVNIAREGIVLGGNANGATESVIANDLISAQGFYVGAAAGTTLTLAPESGNLTFGNTSSWINVLGTADNQGGKVVFDVQDLVLNALTVQSGASASIVSDATLYVNSYGGIVVAENATLSFDGAGEITLGQAIKNGGTVEILNAADTQFVLSNGLMQEIVGVSKTWTLVNNSGMEGLTGTITGWNELGLENFLLDGSALQLGDWDGVRIEDGKVMLYMLTRYWDATGDDGVWNTGADANWRESADSTETVTFETNSRVTFTDTDETRAALDKSVTVADGGVHAKSVTITGSDYVFRGGKVLVNQSLSAQQNARFDSAVVIGSSAPLQLDVEAGATLTLSTLETVSTQSYGGVSYGSGAFSKTGAGTLLITDAINGTITGATVSGGKLVLGVAGAEDVAKTVSLAVGSNTLTTAGGSLENVELLSSGTVKDYTGATAQANNVIKSAVGENYAMLTGVALQAGAATGYASLQKVAFAGNSTLSGYITYESTKQQRQMAVATGGTLTVSNLTFDLHGLSAGTKVLIENKYAPGAAEGFKGELLGWTTDNVTLLYSGIAVNSAAVNMNTAGVVELLTEDKEASRLYWDGLVAGAASSAWDKSSANWSTTAAGTDGIAAFLALSNTYFGATPEGGSKTVNAAQDMVMSNMFVTAGNYSFTGSRLATLGNMYITPESGEVSFANELVAQGNVELRAEQGGSVTLGGALQAGGTITASGEGALRFNSTVQSGGDITLTGNGVVTLAGNVSTAGKFSIGTEGAAVMDKADASTLYTIEGTLTAKDILINMDASTLTAAADTGDHLVVSGNVSAMGDSATPAAADGTITLLGSAAKKFTGFVTADTLRVNAAHGTLNNVITFINVVDVNTLEIAEDTYVRIVHADSDMDTVLLGGTLYMDTVCVTYDNGYDIYSTSDAAELVFGTISNNTINLISGLTPAEAADDVADAGQYNSISVNANTRFLTVNALADLKDLTLYNGPMTVKAGEGAIHGKLLVRDAAGLSLTQNANNIMAEGSGTITVDHANMNLNSTTQTLRSGNDLNLAGGTITGNANGVGLKFADSSTINYGGSNTISANMTVVDGKTLTLKAGYAASQSQSTVALSSDDTLLLSGALSGTGALKLTGDGVVTINKANSAYDGTVTVGGGSSLELTHVDALSKAAISLAGDGTLVLNAGAPVNVARLTIADGASLSLIGLAPTDAADLTAAGLINADTDGITWTKNGGSLTLNILLDQEVENMMTYNLFTDKQALATSGVTLKVFHNGQELDASQYNVGYDTAKKLVYIRTMLGNIWNGGSKLDGETYTADGIWGLANEDANWSGKNYTDSKAAIFVDAPTEESANNYVVVTLVDDVTPGDVYFEADSTFYQLNSAANDDTAGLAVGTDIHKAGSADVNLSLANNGTMENAIGNIDLQKGHIYLGKNLAVSGEVVIAKDAHLNASGGAALVTDNYTAKGDYSNLLMQSDRIAGVADSLGVVTDGIINGAAELNYLNLTGTGKLTDVTIGSGVTVATDATYTLSGLVAFNDTLLNNGTVNFADGVTVELGGLSSNLSEDGTSYIYQLVQGDGTINGLASGITAQDVFINGVNLSAGLADGIATVLSSDKGTVSISIGAITSGENETLTVDGSIAVTSWDARWGEASGQPSLAKRYTGDYDGAYYFAEGADSEYAYNKVVNAANADKVNGGNAIVVYLSAEAFGAEGSELAAPVHGEAFAGHETWVYDSSDVYQVVAGQHFSSAQTGFTQNADTHLYVDANNTQAKAWVVGGSWNVAQEADSYVTVENGTINSLVGAGVFAAAQFGTAHVYVDGGTVTNIYGAGFENGAHLTANTDKNANAVEMLLTGGTITNVYGGAGYHDGADTPNVTGNIAVTVKGNATITTLYGGSMNGGAVTGNINLDLISGSITTVHAAAASGSTLTGNVTVTLHNDDVVTGALYGGKQTTNKVNGKYTSTLYLAEAGEYVFAQWQEDAAGTHDGLNKVLVAGSAVTVAGFDVISLAQGAVLTVDTNHFDRDITGDDTLVITGNGIVQMGGEGGARRAIKLENGATFKLLSSYTSTGYKDSYDNYSNLLVTDGTTLDISGYPRENNANDGNGSLAYRVLLSGDGVDGKGALYKGATDKNHSTNPSGKAALGYIELTGNASATAEHNIAMIGSNNATTYLDLNGYTFTKRGEGAYVLRNTVINGGTYYGHEGTVQPEQTSTGADADLVLAAAATLKLNDNCNFTMRSLTGAGDTELGAFKLTLAPVSGGKYYAAFMDEANSYDNLMSGTGFAYGVYSGTITGAGSLYIGNKSAEDLLDRTGVQYLSGTDSTYSGGTHVEAGRLYLLSSTQGSISKGGSEVTSGPIGTGALYWDSTKAEVYLGHGVTVYNAGGTNAAGSDLILGVEGAPDGDLLKNYPGVNGTVVKDGVTYHEVDTHNLQSISCDGVYADGTAYVAGTEIDRNKMLLVTEAAWNSESSTVKGFTDTGYNEATYSGVLSGEASLVKVGAGTLVIDQANAYTGDTDIQGGTLKLKGWAQIGSAADGTIDVTQTDGTSLMLAYDGTYGDELSSISNNMVLTGTGDQRWDGSEETGGVTAALISDVGSGVTFTLSGDISGEGNLLHSGEGTLVLSGDSSFSGGMHATRGVVEVQSATGLGAGKVNIDSTADLHVTVEEGTTDSRVTTTLAATGTTVQGDVVISGTESTERILNVATGGYDNSSTTLHDNGTLLVNGAGVAASTGTLSGTGTVAVSDATGTGAKATVGQMTAYTGDFVVEGNNASITVENGNYSGGSISVSGNDAVLSTKGDITITNGESLSLSSRGNAGAENDAAYVTTTGSVSVASGATLSVSDAATSYEYNLQNLQAAASLNGAAGLKDGSAGEMHAFGANTGADAEDVYSGFFNTSVAMNQKAAGAVDAKGGLTMASGATYETAMANTSLMGGSLTLESGLTLSTTLDLGAAAIDGSGRTTQLVLFSDVSGVNFVMDGILADAENGGIYYTKAENYITGNYIDEDTWLVYDSGAGVVYLDGIVPEPTTATLSLLALAALAARRRRR